MIARFAFAVLMIVLSGWLYWLTALVMRAIDRAEQIIDREHGSLPDPAPLLDPLWAAAGWLNDRMQPAMAEDVRYDLDEVAREFGVDLGEPEQPITEPSPVVRPSPVPREVEPLITEPMELADEMAADAHAYVAREAVLSDEEWQAKQEAEWAAIKADIAKMAKGVTA